MIRCFVLVLALIASAPAFGQSFSCRIGTTPACLDYGEKVCSSTGKCVDANTACFDTYQCDFEGFTCRSNVTACVEKYDDLLYEHNESVEDYNNLLARIERVQSEAEDTSSCVRWATSLDEAQRCY